jgi:hypothetical protein
MMPSLSRCAHTYLLKHLHGDLRHIVTMLRLLHSFTIGYLHGMCAVVCTRPLRQHLWLQLRLQLGLHPWHALGDRWRPTLDQSVTGLSQPHEQQVQRRAAN